MHLIFSVLWRNHPANQAPPDLAPCVDKHGESRFGNQCAIRMSIALERSGVPMNTYAGQRCAAHNHPLRAEEFKDWLNSAAAWPYLPHQVVIRRNVTWQDYRDESGIVVWRNFYDPTGRRDEGPGDHVDLWNGTKVAVGRNDYFDRSREVWFWRIP